MIINHLKIILGFILGLFCCSVYGQMQYLNNDDNALHLIERYQHLYKAARGGSLSGRGLLLFIINLEQCKNGNIWRLDNTLYETGVIVFYAINFI